MLESIFGQNKEIPEHRELKFVDKFIVEAINL